MIRISALEDSLLLALAPSVPWCDFMLTPALSVSRSLFLLELGRSTHRANEQLKSTQKLQDQLLELSRESSQRFRSCVWSFVVHCVVDDIGTL